MNDTCLTVLPSVPVWIDGETVVFDRKFYDGMLKYQQYWEGTVKCIMRKSVVPWPEFGIYRKMPEEIPFEVLILSENEPIGLDHLRGTAIVLAAGDDFNQLHVSEICRREAIGCVYVIENIPETRHQMINIDKLSPLVKLRRHFYIWNGERKRVAAFHKAHGLQTNGTAAYDHYDGNPNRLLYFDTRVETETIISDHDLQQRLDTLSRGQPLRLAFSGRLIGMKGADHLIELAALLKQRSCDFVMTIYGTGDLESAMAENIRQKQLGDQVRLAGAVDFRNELIPAIKAGVDLYVMLHRQSDPSCTYLETLACGIPIVGYANKAFSGLLLKADVGWSKPIDDLSGIADIIEHLTGNRSMIDEKSRKAATFSRAHDFESTFLARIEQLRFLSGLPGDHHLQ
jgi:glycosyltransferase involved in cell wall biosynthesis